jgi:endonuclease/exonuclease/phosphatase family metal-dependent hydrolase
MDVIRLRQMRQLLAGIAGDLHLPQLAGGPQGGESGNGNGNGNGVHHLNNGNGNGKGSYVPVIITGDFNTTPGSLPCKVRTGPQSCCW